MQENKSSHQRCSVKKGVLKMPWISQESACVEVSLLVKFQARGLQLYQKEIATRVISCEICEIFRNSYLWTAASIGKLFSPVCFSLKTKSAIINPILSQCSISVPSPHRKCQKAKGLVGSIWQSPWLKLRDSCFVMLLWKYIKFDDFQNWESLPKVWTTFFMGHLGLSSADVP